MNHRHRTISAHDNVDWLPSEQLNTEEIQESHCTDGARGFISRDGRFIWTWRIRLVDVIAGRRRPSAPPPLSRRRRRTRKQKRPFRVSSFSDSRKPFVRPYMLDHNQTRVAVYNDNGNSRRRRPFGSVRAAARQTRRPVRGTGARRRDKPPVSRPALFPGWCPPQR